MMIDNKNQPIRIAQVMGKMEKGGVESVVMNFYRHIDKTKFQFDFFVDSDSSCPQEKEIRSLGGKVYKIAPYQKIKNNMNDLEVLFKKNNYKIVHSQLTTMSIFSLRVAKKCNIPIRICHGHNTASKGETKKNILKYILRPLSKNYATDYCACSKYAGEWLFGKNADVTIFANAIDLNKFKHDEKTAEVLKKELNIKNKFIIGHIGRFCFQKNHDFLIDIFNEIYKKNNDSVLLLIGEGDLSDRIKDKVKSLHLEKSVVFLGVKENVWDYYKVMDAFVLPSHYEGLGIVAIEAQASGIPTIVSDAVPNEADVTNLIKHISLKKSAEEWANKIIEYKNLKNTDYHNNRLSDYDINIECKKLEKYYYDLLAVL